MINEKIYLKENNKDVYIETFVSDVYKKKRDAMLVIPGGGYGCVCDNREGEPIAMAYNALNYNCFVLHYTVNPHGEKDESKNFPTQLIEASLAMKYIRENAERYYVNPDRVFCVGFSAGGHLAGSLATMWHIPQVVNAIGRDDGINKPTAAVICYGVLSANAYRHAGSYVNLAGGTPDDETLAMLSIVNHVDEKTSPCFLYHTMLDSVVPVQNSIEMAHTLADKKIPFSLHIYTKGEHGSALCNDITDSCGASTDAAKWVEMSDFWMRNEI